MLQHYLGSKEHIQRAHLEAELPGTLLQDALAVANFPSKNRLLHIEKWSKGHLPNPFLHRDSATIDRLDRLYAQLEIYIEDYITKATSIFPPRAYMCIPNPYSNANQLQFRGNPIGIDILRVDSLTDVERNRLFRAFIRYELASKARGDELSGSVTSAFKNLSHGEAEGLRCVHYYMRDLCGGVFAHHANSRLPDIPAKTAAEKGNLNPEGGLIFPNNIWFSPDTFLRDAFAKKQVPRQLGFLGFNLMTRLLSGPRDNRGCPIRLMAEIPMRLQQLDWTRVPLTSDIFEEGEYSSPLHDRQWDDWSEVGQALRDNGSITFAYGMQRFSVYSALQRKIYRQRAWAFFDRADYYPDGSVSRHFPTLRQLNGGLRT
ncbi:uncharacterized protein FSUBG_3364 [Fusarium subglutinans]|uniref:Uncharacterized protein n=1 Tax=Gibberella subglutinans TaxID=42677 RepID=A0A8H5Q8W4_GIBSU|nr:uncharacterized protein FSUBG_3364 [Fusarium subglutinans]KAF5610132.1 hypothetical protein FSUBG_3364 [Fusarium subglutinans]